MTRLQFWPVNNHYYVPLRLWGMEGPQSDPVIALVDTGATKCSIPKSMNDTVFHLPVVDHDSNVITASNPQGYDIVKIPLMTLVRINPIGPNNFKFDDTDLQEVNVPAWLASSYTVGMNWLSKFNISLRREGFMIIERESPQRPNETQQSPKSSLPNTEAQPTNQPTKIDNDKNSKEPTAT